MSTSWFVVFKYQSIKNYFAIYASCVQYALCIEIAMMKTANRRHNISKVPKALKIYL